METLDDGSWDIDGQGSTPEFNAVTIQRDIMQLKRNAAPAEVDETTAVSSSVSELDASVSTLHLDSCSLSSSISESPSQFHTPLSDEQPSGRWDSDSQTDGCSHTESDPKDIPDDTDAAYPAVHIDVSQPFSRRVFVTTPNGDSIPVENNDGGLNTSKPTSPTPSNLAISASQSLPLPSTSDSTQANHRPTLIAGPSTFQKVVSKTRPYFLPPKSRKEDRKHLADWEAMMKESRAAEERRRKTLQERRLAREMKIEQSIHTWEKEIIPDWRIVHRNPTLRKLWWNGIPTKLRPMAWERAAGNTLALNRDNYRNCYSRAKRALSSGAFPEDILQAIEEDISTTLPALHLFHPETGPLYQELKDMLCAWVISRADEGLVYRHGIAKIAAMMLINIPAPQAFIAMRNLLERHCLRSFYGGTGAKEDVDAYYRIFDTLLADSMPKIYFNFKQHQISPAAYLPDWLAPLFLDHLPFEACARLWDVILLEGDSFLFRAALAILAVLEPRLFFPGRDELLQLLKGQDKAAIEVAKREGRALNGGKYEIYGVDEEALWDRIDSMEDWWRESTWKRLTQRELPDL
ncbi:rab-GTPase-TBC domain-containing protein [Scleroderma yunnanense]